MATATALLNACREEVGYREGPNNNNKYGIWYGMNNNPYCAMGLSYCAAKVGGLSEMGGKWAYCPWWADWFRSRGQFHTSGFRRGDILFFDWSGKKRRGYEAHVAVLESMDGSYAKTIEFNTVSGTSGNQSDGGGVYKRTRHISLIVGAGRPKYTPETNVVPIVTVPVSHSTTRNILTVDGVWGKQTTKRLQAVLKVSQTGTMDAPTYRAFAIWLRQRPTGGFSLQMKTALQGRVGVSNDGVIGPITVKAFQRYLNRMAATTLSA